MSKPRENKDLFYKYNREMLIDLVLQYESTMALAKASDVNYNTMYLLVEDKYGRSLVSEEVAVKLAELRGVPFDEMFTLTPKVKHINESQELTYMALSERILVGLKANIEKRLSTTHSASYVNDIIKLVDDIIVEAAYLGVCSERDKQSDYICKKVQRRRSNQDGD